MKKILISTIVTLLSVFAIPAAASATEVSASQTFISGTVRQSGSPVNGASVHVTCNSVFANDTTDATGAYGVLFSATDCPSGATATASATKGSASGSNSGSVAPHTALNLAIVDVNIALPEMGAITGALATVAAGGAFMVIRRRNANQS